MFLTRPDSNIHRNVYIPANQTESVKNAIVEFMKGTDPKATIVPAFRFYRSSGTSKVLHPISFNHMLINWGYIHSPNSQSWRSMTIKSLPQPFKKFLNTDHGGTLKNSRYTSGNIDDKLETPDEGTDLEGPFPRPIIGTGVMNTRCIAIEIF